MHGRRSLDHHAVTKQNPRWSASTGVAQSRRMAGGLGTGRGRRGLTPSHWRAHRPIGCCAFLAGPPRIGFLGNKISDLRAIACMELTPTACTVNCHAAQVSRGPSNRLIAERDHRRSVSFLLLSLG